jgi:hypothetical protein
MCEALVLFLVFQKERGCNPIYLINSSKELLRAVQVIFLSALLSPKLGVIDSNFIIFHFIGQGFEQGSGHSY